MSNYRFKGTSFRSLQTQSIVTKSALLSHLKVKNKAEFDNDVIMKGSLYIRSNLLESKNILTDQGFTIGGEPDKDMANQGYTEEFDPNSYQSEFFPDMANFIDSNIVAGDKAEEDRLIASYWDDLGNDVFDDWGYFYLYDVDSGKYYFPLISPQNQDDGIITTQVFNTFGRTFTIKHGWTVQGIFKFDISVNDSKPFRFGAYGNMGSDGDEFTEDLTQAYTLSGNDLTLYYHHHAESGDSNEILYSYFIPKNISENISKTYDAYYDSDDMSIVSKEITSGLLVYFSKKNDVKNWVINDLVILSASSINSFSVDEAGNVEAKGNTHVIGSILARGTNLGRLLFISIPDEDYTPSTSSLVNGYFISSSLNDNRTFIIPSAADIVSAIPNCAVNTFFRFTINNVQSGNYSRNLTTTDGSVTIDSTCINTSVVQYAIFSYIVLITNATLDEETAIVLQDCTPFLF